MIRTIILFIAFIFYCQLAIAQTNYQSGYKEGLKNGFCYNKKEFVCFYPVAVLFPMPRLNESANNYRQGYNRGFQVGLDIQRIEGSNSNINNDYYEAIRKEMPIVQANEFIPPYDLNLMTSVNMRKQRLFDSRREWLSMRVNRIIDLNYAVLSEVDLMKQVKIHNYLIDNFSTMSADLTNENTFNNIVRSLNNIEEQIRSTYNSYEKPKQVNSDGIKIPIVTKSNTKAFFKRNETGWNIIWNGKTLRTNVDISHIGTQNHSMQNGSIGEFIVYKEINSNRHYYVPTQIFYSGLLGEDYPIFCTN